MDLTRIWREVIDHAIEVLSNPDSSDYAKDYVSEMLRQSVEREFIDLGSESYSTETERIAEATGVPTYKVWQVICLDEARRRK